jgi:hypothetical protein
MGFVVILNLFVPVVHIILFTPIKLNTKFEKLWNNKSREQILLNLTIQYGVQKYIFIRKFNEIHLCEVIT